MKIEFKELGYMGLSSDKLEIGFVGLCSENVESLDWVWLAWEKELRESWQGFWEIKRL